MRMHIYIAHILISIFIAGCLQKLTPTYIENILLGDLKQSSNEQPNLFSFECPRNEVLHLVIGLRSEGLSDAKIEKIRKTWENNYNTSVQIYDSSHVLVFSETFNKERSNISTGGNWLKPHISFILLKSIEKSLIPGNNYNMQISVSGDGLQEYSLDLFLNRAYLKKDK